MAEPRRWRLPVFLAFLFLGFLLSVQFRAQQQYLRDLSSQKTEDLVLMLRKLNTKKAELERELAVLEKQRHSYEEGVSAGAVLADNIKKEIGRLEMVLGLTPAVGPGVTITIPENSPIVYMDLVDLVNELWASQAEAIAVNDVRVTPWTSIFWDEKKLTITVNGRALSLPCTIKAIGDPEKLEAGLRLLGGVLDDLALYNVYPEIKRLEEVEVPAASLPPLKHL